MTNATTTHWRIWLARVAASSDRHMLAPATADAILAHIERVEDQLEQQRKERVRAIVGASQEVPG